MKKKKVLAVAWVFNFVLFFIFTNISIAHHIDPVTNKIVEGQHLVAGQHEEKVILENIQKIPLTIFERYDCAHCQDEKLFLNELSKTRSDFEIIDIDIYTKEGEAKFDQITKLEKLSKATPITLVGNTIIQGFATTDTTGKKIEELLNQSIGKKTLTFEEFLSAGGSGGNVEQVAGGTCDENSTECVIKEDQFLVKVPFYGMLDLKPYSLPAISSILGFIDGFNPCAMWVLVTFLILLIQVGDRKKMWQIAGLFVLAEAIMYYLILNVWFTTWDFIGLDNIVTPVIGLVAIGGGIFFLYEGFTSDGSCKITDLKQKQKTRERIKEIISRPMNLLTAVAIIGMALSVNIIEFACSIGIPQAFTKIIEINQLSWLKSQFYMFLYILFYMIDDFIVFGLALYSFDKLHLTTKYAKYSNLIGGILMVILGYLLIFRPEVLMF
jgi:hypothetical protein